MKNLCLLTLLLSFPGGSFAQDAAQPTAAQVIVPRLVRFSGQVKDAGGTVGITFTLHKSQNDNDALWVETQNVTLDANGKYTVLLGATKSEGLPMELFTSGEAQWLGIHVQGQVEQPRVLLVSVPYALKAAEAETLGGHSAGDFVTSDKVTTLVKEQMQNAATPAAQGSAAKQTTSNTTAALAGPTKFSGTTTDNIVAATQSGTGTAVTAVAKGTAVYGASTNTSGNAYGVKGQTASSSGFGVYGLNTATAGSAVGIYGQSSSNAGVALSGLETSTTGTTKGVVAAVESPNGIAMVVQADNQKGKLISGQATSSHTEVFSVDGYGNLTTIGGISSPSINGNGGSQAGVAGFSSSIGVLGQGSSGGLGVWGQSDTGTAVEGTTSSPGGYAVEGINNSGTGIYGVTKSSSGTGVYGNGGVSSADTIGVYGIGGTGVFGNSQVGGGKGVYGYAGMTGGTGVSGFGAIGVSGLGNPAMSATGNSTSAVAYSGTSDSGVVFSGTVTGSGGYAVDTFAASKGYAAWFNGDTEIYNGNLSVTGSISAGTKDFKIDHPLDPTGKYLVHASVESSEMKNIYDGMVTTDAGGEAVIELPDWFEALNGDFRYQLTTIGQPAQAWIAARIANHRFTIRTDKPNVEISWQVTGVRQDAYAKTHPLVVEEEKPEIERGSYLYPEAFGQPEEKSAGWARRPAAMKHWKEVRSGTLPAVQLKSGALPTAAK